jgi:cobalt/nickel transport system permease protein
MHISTFDRYQARASLIHQLDPRLKVVVTVLFIVSNALLPDGAWLAFLASWGLILLAGRLSQLRLGYLFKRSFVALPFALAAVTVLFTLPGQPLVSWSWGDRVFTISQTGAARFASIVVRSWLSVQMAILLTAVTRFPDLIHALRHLRLPPILISIISFMYRYLFVLADEAMRLLRAREARSARPYKRGGGGSFVWRAGVAGGMVGQLFLRSMERSDRVYNAMLARGYQGQLLTINPHQMSGRDWQAGLGAVLLLLVIQLAGRLG